MPPDGHPRVILPRYGPRYDVVRVSPEFLVRAGWADYEADILRNRVLFPSQNGNGPLRVSWWDAVTCPNEGLRRQAAAVVLTKVGAHVAPLVQLGFHSASRAAQRWITTAIAANPAVSLILLYQLIGSGRFKTLDELFAFRNAIAAGATPPQPSHMIWPANFRFSAK